MTRAFIVGNGISLKETNLDLLIGEVTFAMNRIDLLYEPANEYGIMGTKWRPTYYLYFEYYPVDSPAVSRPSIGDPFVEYVVPHHLIAGEKCLFRSLYREHFDDKVRNHRKWRGRYLPQAHWVTVDCAHCGMDITHDARPDEWHLPSYCRYGGTMNPALQFAFTMGFDPVILIGCDLGFEPIYRASVADPNHFHPDYWTWDDGRLEDRDATLIHMHENAKREYEKRDRTILNATIGGKLEVYDRVDFNSLFEKEKDNAVGIT